ncbi:MAG: hypothetical protein Q9218_000414 [Villophora microphyllina]
MTLPSTAEQVTKLSVKRQGKMLSTVATCVTESKFFAYIGNLRREVIILGFAAANETPTEKAARVANKMRVISHIDPKCAQYQALLKKTLKERRNSDLIKSRLDAIGSLRTKPYELVKARVLVPATREMLRGILRPQSKSLLANHPKRGMLFAASTNGPEDL